MQQTELSLGNPQNEPLSCLIEASPSAELQTLNQLANALLEQENWDAAIAAYQQILSQYPEFDWGYHHLAFVLSQIDRFQEADAVYEQLARLNPAFWANHRNDVQVQQQLGDYLFRRQDWLRAIKAYRWTIELNPTIAHNYLKLGQTLIAIGQWQEAETVLHQAIQQEPTLTEAYVCLGDLYLQQEDLSGSLAVYEKASALSPNQAEIQGKLAVLQASSQAAPPQLDGRDKKFQNQISLLVNPQLLQELYAATPKLFVAAADAATVETLQSFDTIRFYQFSFNPATRTGTIAPLTGTRTTGTHSSAPLAELSWAPMFCHGFVTATAEGRSQLKPLMDWWRAQGEAEIPPAIDLSSITHPVERQAEFWKWLCGQTVAETVHLGDRLSTLQKQYLELRSLHETVQNAFATVESFLSQAKLPALQLAFETHPTKHSVTQESGTASSQLQQLLPLSSRGLAAIEFYVAAANPHAEGALTVTIYSPDDETALASWQIPYAHLTPSWFQLDLPSLDLGRKRDVYLQIDWQTRLGPAPSLSLSNLQPIPEAQAKLNQVPIDRSLALRLWTGLPGSRRNYSPYLTLSEAIDPAQSGSDPHSRSGDLGQRAMQRVVEVTPNLPTDDLAYIRILNEGQKILTHARSSGVTVAMLPFGFAAGATQVRASVETQDEKAGVIEYAIALVKERDLALSCFTNDPAAAAAFSGWTSIAPNTPHQLTLTLPEALDEPCHIVFGTRTPVGGSNAYGWACWLNFHVVFPA